MCNNSMPLLCHMLAVAFVQIFIVSGNWILAKNINFYNVRLPVDPTPFPSSFKCFTCDNVVDNYNCNRWAEDKWCPLNTQYCLTVHHFTNYGRSTSVTKKCATREECHFVGCRHYREATYTVSITFHCKEKQLKSGALSVHPPNGKIGNRVNLAKDGNTEFWPENSGDLAEIDLLTFLLISHQEESHQFLQAKKQLSIQERLGAMNYLPNTKLEVSA